MRKNNAGYILSAPAKADLQQAIKIGVERFGLMQARSYTEQIADTLDLLVHHPEMGNKRPDLWADVRCFPVGSHVIYYRSKPERLEVIRILHQRMDAGLHMNQQSF